jgi:hypothetical protein
MTGSRSWLTGFGCLLLLAPSVVAAPPSAAAAPVRAAAPPAALAEVGEDREYQQLLERLTALSELIVRNAQSPQVWRYNLDQAEATWRLAARSDGKERENWLRMVVDSHYAAAVQSPANDLTATQRLAQLPSLIAQAYPGSPVVAYAALQEVQADYIRVLQQAGDNPVGAQMHRCERLAQFALAYPATPEAPRALQEAAQTCESLGKTAEAVRYYRTLAATFPGQALGRKAEGSLWRLSRGGEPVHLELPVLYAVGEGAAPPFNLRQLQGKLVVVYFWVSSSAQAAEDFQTLKRLTDRWQDHGLEVVYVNLDGDAAQARAFLSGRLTAGVHLCQGGGLEAPVAERFGLQSLPQAFVVDPNGNLIRHSLQAAQLEAETARHLTHDH